MIANVLRDLVFEGSDLAIEPLETGGEELKSEFAVQELPTKRGLKAGLYKQLMWMRRVKRLARQTNPTRIIVNPSKPFFLLS